LDWGFATPTPSLTGICGNFRLWLGIEGWLSEHSFCVRVPVMANHPLAEVFGFPTDNQSADAVRYRRQRLCPFNNKVPNCTKGKAENPSEFVVFSIAKPWRSLAQFAIEKIG
jgi:hypothetical protein